MGLWTGVVCDEASEHVKLEDEYIVRTRGSIVGTSRKVEGRFPMGSFDSFQFTQSFRQRFGPGVE
jgi:hypothetical protein